MLIISAGEDQEKKNNIEEQTRKHQELLQVKDAWADPKSLYIRLYSI